MIPELEFTAFEKQIDPLKPVWKAIRDKEYWFANQAARSLMSDPEFDNVENRAALLIAVAATEFNCGSIEQVKFLAEESLALCSSQWSGYRILAHSYCIQQKFELARITLSAVPLNCKPAAWDEPMDPLTHHLAIASLAWKEKLWDEVSTQVHLAYPKGYCGMPDSILEDVFRMALYRQKPDEAATCAECFILNKPVEIVDNTLQTLVQQGWLEQALALYQKVYRTSPKNELYRRRLVGLCIRTGALEEARRLSAPGALEIAA